MDILSIGSGGRKTSKAVARLFAGSGEIKVNRKPLETYFPDNFIQEDLKRPLQTAQAAETYNVDALVRGGGKTAQAEAIRLAISRALVKINEELRHDLRAGNLLTRDPRMKERKKYGRKSARRGYQWTKR